MMGGRLGQRADLNALPKVLALIGPFPLCSYLSLANSRLYSPGIPVIGFHANLETGCKVDAPRGFLG